jgi:hypothetical protein
MKKVQCVGAGFNPTQSSNSNLKPKTFEWSTEYQDIQVLIDDSILYANKIDKKFNQKRYGWVCESSAIVSKLTESLEDLYEVIIEEGEFEAIFTNNQKLLDIDDCFIYNSTGSNFPWIPMESWGMNDKINLCSMVASAKLACPGHQYRHEIAAKFKDKLDLFGGVCESPRIGISDNLKLKWNDKRSAICPYMFSIVMENESVPNYYTEKLTDCFATGTIPIYWGATNIEHKFDDRGIIVLDDKFDIDSLDANLYESMRTYAETNLETVRSLEMADDELYKKI